MTKKFNPVTITEVLNETYPDWRCYRIEYKGMLGVECPEEEEVVMWLPNYFEANKLEDEINSSINIAVNWTDLDLEDV
jgi:hypothetical protein